MHRYTGEGAIEGRRRWLYMQFYSGLTRVPDLVRHGIDGIKIEGRSRSHHYVRLVTSTFAEAVKRSAAGDLRGSERWARALAEAALFSEITEGFAGERHSRKPPARTFSNRSRIAFLQERIRILLANRHVSEMVSELKLGAEIDVVESWRQQLAQLRRDTGVRKDRR